MTTKAPAKRRWKMPAIGNITKKPGIDPAFVPTTIDDGLGLARTHT
jgi:hypothetical protein